MPTNVPGLSLETALPTSAMEGPDTLIPRFVKSWDRISEVKGGRERVPMGCWVCSKEVGLLPAVKRSMSPVRGPQGPACKLAKVGATRRWGSTCAAGSWSGPGGEWHPPSTAVANQLNWESMEEHSRTSNRRAEVGPVCENGGPSRGMGWGEAGGRGKLRLDWGFFDAILEEGGLCPLARAGGGTGGS